MSWVIKMIFDFVSKAASCSGRGDSSKEGLVLDYVCCEDLNLVRCQQTLGQLVV